MSEALFEPDGTFFVPTPLTRGPWTPLAQHGGPPAGLAAHLIESFEGGESMFVARVTVELLRPVPLTPLSAQVRLSRPGKKVQLVEVSLWTNGQPGDATAIEAVRATGLRVRRGELGGVDELSAPNSLVDERDRVILGPEAGVVPTFGFPGNGFHRDAVDLRFVNGDMVVPGPGTMWARLRQPVVAGVQPTGVVRSVALADFGNAVSSVVNAETTSYINADLTVNLHREPVGDWICLDGVTRLSSLGVGQAMCTLHDQGGPVGRSAASLLIERRELSNRTGAEQLGTFPG